MDDEYYFCIWCGNEVQDDEHAPWCCRECEEEDLDDADYRNNCNFGN